MSAQQREAGRAARCRRPPARRRRSAPWPDSCPIGRLRAVRRRSRRRGRSQPCSSQIACIAARTSSAVSPSRELADQPRGDAPSPRRRPAGRGGCRRAARRVLRAPARRRSASGSTTSSMPAGAQVVGDGDRELGRHERRARCPSCAARAQRELELDVVGGSGPASSSSSRAERVRVEHLDAERAHLVGVEHADRRGAAAAVLEVEERVDDPASGSRGRGRRSVSGAP